jgi:putative aldouronate transport system substrate-binding protein
MNRKPVIVWLGILALLVVTLLFAVPAAWLQRADWPGSAGQRGGGTAKTPKAGTVPLGKGELSWKQDTSPFTFTQYFYGNWATDYLWNDQYDMKLIEAKTGVRIDRKLAVGSDDDYLNMMIATGNLPDSIMLDWNNPAVSKLINDGLVYSMNDLIDKYAPEFWKMLDPEMVKYHSVNGKLWYLPNNYESENRLKNGAPIVSIRPWFIRKDIYEALGSPKVETVEDLLHVLEQAKRIRPDLSPVGLDIFDVNKNGFEGSLSMDYLIYSFSPRLLEERIKDDSKIVEYPMRSAGFINAFRFLNTLYRKGLLDPKLLITKSEQYTDAMYRGSYIVASQYISDMFRKFNPLIANTLGPDKQYVELDGLSANGHEPRYPATRLLGWQGLFITKKAKHPERIIRFAEYAWSDEGQMDFRYGKEGETYEMVNGLPQYKPDVRNLMNRDINAWTRKYGFNDSTLLWREGKLWDQANLRDLILSRTDEYNAAMKLQRFNYDDYSLGMENLEPDSTSPEGVINANIKDLWNKTIPLLVMADSDREFSTVYSDFIDQIDKLGADRVEKVMYQRHLLDLKKKGLR